MILSFSPSPLLWLTPILLAVGYCDLKYMRIPNALSIVIVGLFVLLVLVQPPQDLMLRVVVAGLVFALGFVGFCFRILGGGDVKILGALLLFVPVESLVVFANLLSVSLLLGVAFIVGIRKTAIAEHSTMKAVSGSSGFPMGISIALAGIAQGLFLTNS